MQRLLDIGFHLAGEWGRRDTQADPLKFKPCREFTQMNTLYAFVVGEEIAYVGKTVRGLKTRMGDYERGNSAKPNTTNHRNWNKLLKKLQEPKQVFVYAMESLVPISVGTFELNVAAGLEDSIIAELNPPWNDKNKEVLLQDDADWVFAPVTLPSAHVAPARPPEPTPTAVTPAAPAT